MLVDIHVSSHRPGIKVSVARIEFNLFSAHTYRVQVQAVVDLEF